PLVAPDGVGQGRGHGRVAAVLEGVVEAVFLNGPVGGGHEPCPRVDAHDTAPEPVAHRVELFDAVDGDVGGDHEPYFGSLQVRSQVEDAVLHPFVVSRVGVGEPGGHDRVKIPRCNAGPHGPRVYGGETDVVAEPVLQHRRHHVGRSDFRVPQHVTQVDLRL